MTSNYKEQISFELTMFSYFSQIYPNVSDDVINLGTFSIDASALTTRNTDCICDYIMTHADDFFVKGRYEKMEKIQSFRAIKTPALKFTYISNKKDAKINTYVFISNIRKS